MNVLRDLLFTDIEPEDRLDILAAYCRTRFDVYKAMITVIHAEQQWVKRHRELVEIFIPETYSFCRQTLADGNVFEVPDTLQDPRFSDNTLVCQEPRVRYYVGTPLAVQPDKPFGTLCLLDFKPKHLSCEDKVHLRKVARLMAEDMLQSRLVPPEVAGTD